MRSGRDRQRTAARAASALAQRLEPRIAFHGGYLEVSFGGGDGISVTDLEGRPNSSGEGIVDAFTLPDGRIRAVIRDDDTNPIKSSLAGFTVDGQLDPTFPIRTLSWTNAQVTRLLPTADGTKMLVVGASQVARYTLDGAIDSSFGTAGLSADGGAFAAPTADGHILVGIGYGIVKRLNGNGTLDSSFFGGQYTPPITPDSNTVAYVAERPGGGLFIQRYNEVLATRADGSLDPTFDGDGRISGAFAGALALPDGKLLLSEERSFFGGAYDSVVRRLSSGAVDPTFAAGAGLDVRLNQYTAVTKLQLMPDGNVIGLLRIDELNTGGAFGLTRIRPDGTFDPSFGYNGVAYQSPAQRDVPYGYLINGSHALIFGTTTRAADTNPVANDFTNMAMMQFVLDGPNEPHLSVSSTIVNEGQMIHLRAEPTLAAGRSVVEYQYSLGSGLAFGTPVFAREADVRAGASPSAEVRVLVTLDDGSRIPASVPITINNVAPTLTALRTVVNVARGRTNFSLPILAADAADKSLTIRFDYGTAGAQEVSQIGYLFSPRAYSTNGTYTLTVTARDEAASSAPVVITVIVHDLAVTVFNDLDDDGQGSFYGEPGLANVLVFLDQNADGINQSTEPTALTDASGTAWFDGIGTGVQRAAEIVPAGFRPSSGYANSLTPNVTTSVGGAVTFPLTQQAAITYTVFNDLNGDGIRQTNESYSTTAIAFLDLDRDATLDIDERLSTSLSDDVPTLVFRNLTPGVSQRVVLLPGAGLPPITAPIDLTPGPGQLIDLGAIPLVPHDANQPVVVFIDTNGDGIRQTDETAIDNALVFDDRDGDGVPDVGSERTRRVRAAGGYADTSPSGWARGPIALSLLVPAGFVPTSPTRVNRTLAAGTNATIYFGIAGADTSPPSVVSVTYDTTERPAVLRIKYSEDTPGLSANSIRIARLSGNPGSTFTPSVGGYAYDPATFTQTIRLQTTLDDGHFRLTINPQTLAGIAGPANTLAQTFDFFILAGDANHDRHVDFSDLVIVAQNYNQTGRSLSQGDFNFDGRVDFADLVILAQKFNTTLPAYSVLQVAAPISATQKSRKSIAAEIV